MEDRQVTKCRDVKGVLKASVGWGQGGFLEGAVSTLGLKAMALNVCWSSSTFQTNVHRSGVVILFKQLLIHESGMRPETAFLISSQ